MVEIWLKSILVFAAFVCVYRHVVSIMYHIAVLLVVWSVNESTVYY